MAKYQELILTTATLIMIFAVGASAQTPEPRLLTSEQEHDDCTDVSVDYVDDPMLTRQEKLALMDQALQKSLSTFERCQRKRLSRSAGSAANSSAGGGGGGQPGDQEGGHEGGSASTVSIQSAASSDLAGEETQSANTASATSQEPLASAASGSIAGTETGPDPAPAVTEASDEYTAGAETASNQLGNGQIPEDIPSADNDSVLEAQIRRAAMAEKDPEIRAKLWNEYRKYKGLPEVI